jgi:hypothetical protein
MTPRPKVQQPHRKEFVELRTTIQVERDALKTALVPRLPQNADLPRSQKLLQTPMVHLIGQF